MIERFKSWAGLGLAGTGEGPVTIQLGGRMTMVSRAELGVLNQMAQTGMLRKSIDAGVGTTGIGTQGVPAFWFARSVEGGGGADSLTNPYAKSVWVMRAIKSIAGPVASVKVCFLNSALGEDSGFKGARGKMGMARRKKLWMASGRVKELKGGQDEAQEEVSLPEVSAWLERPMRGLNYSDFVEASIGWMKMQECFWLLSDETLKPFPEVATTYPPVIVARPNLMRAVIEGGELMGWVFSEPGGKQHSLLPDQVIQLRYWNPESDFRGLGEYEAAHLAAEADYLAGKFARNLMANNGDLGGVIIAKSGVPTDDQREQIIMDLRAKRAAQLRGDLRYTFLTGDIEMKDPKITSVDAPFITQRLENRHEIALAFGVPPSKFDVKAAYSIGSASDTFDLITNTCIPTGQKFCDALERLIYRMTGQRVEVGMEWEDHPVMQAVRRESFQALDTLCNRGMPVKDASEYLSLDLPRFAGDDVGFVPINITPIDQASEPPPEPGSDPAMGEGSVTENEEAENPAKALRKAFREFHISDLKVQKKAKKEGRKKLWENHMRARSGVLRAYEGKVGKVLNEFRVIALRKLEEHGAATTKAMGDGEAVRKGLIDFIFDAREFGKKLVLSLNPVAQAAIETATVQVLGEIGKPHDPWRMPPPKAKELIRSRDANIMGTGATVRGQINTALEAGYDAGETTEQLQERVRGVFNGMSKGEARRIAATETAIVFNGARREAGVAAGVTHHAWLSSHGPNVRPAHEDAEERYIDQPIPMGKAFEVGGEELMHPGDPSGSAENIINCQCVEIMSAAPEAEAEGEED